MRRRWNCPEIPMLPAGQDALSATISAVLPTLAAPLAANVATLSAKENMFSGKLGAAQAAYQNSDDAGRSRSARWSACSDRSASKPGRWADGGCTRAGDRRADRHVRLADAAGHAGGQRRWGGQSSGGQGAGGAAGATGRRRPSQAGRAVSHRAAARRRRRRRRSEPPSSAKNPSSRSANRCTAPKQMTAPWQDRPTMASTARRR